jgi:hypothetical protein
MFMRWPNLEKEVRVSEEFKTIRYLFSLKCLVYVEAKAWIVL